MSAQAVVVYYQPLRLRPAGTVPQAPDGAEGQGITRDVGHDDPTPHDVLCEVREVVEGALDAAGLTKADAARRMGITPTQLGRQLQNLDNQQVSFQRLWRLDDRFWRELWVRVAERRKLARVRRRVVFDI